MMKISKAQLDAAVDKAFAHLMVGPYLLLWQGMHAELKRTETTMDGVLRYAEQQSMSVAQDAGHTGMRDAANDNDPTTTPSAPLIRVCQILGGVKKAATIYATTVLNAKEMEHIVRQTSSIQHDLGMKAQNVESPHLFSIKKSRHKIRQQVIDIMQQQVNVALPEQGMQIAFNKFDHAVCDVLGIQKSDTPGRSG